MTVIPTNTMVGFKAQHRNYHSSEVEVPEDRTVRVFIGSRLSDSLIIDVRLELVRLSYLYRAHVNWHPIEGIYLRHSRTTFKLLKLEGIFFFSSRSSRPVKVQR